MRRLMERVKSGLERIRINAGHQDGVVTASLEVTRFSLNVMIGFIQLRLKLGFPGICFCAKYSCI